MGLKPGCFGYIRPDIRCSMTLQGISSFMVVLLHLAGTPATTLGVKRSLRFLPTISQIISVHLSSAVMYSMPQSSIGIPYDAWTDRRGENSAPRTQCGPFSGASEKNHTSDQSPFCLPHDRAVGRRNRRSTCNYTAHLVWYYQYNTSPCMGSSRSRRDDQQSTDLLSLYTSVSYVNAPRHCHSTDAYLSVAHPHYWGQNRDPFPCLWLAGLSRLLSGLAGIHPRHYRHRA